MRAKILLFLILSLFAFIPVKCETQIEYDETEIITYIIYEGFYDTMEVAQKQKKLMESMEFKDLSVVKTRVQGQEKFAVKVAETDSYQESSQIVRSLKLRRFGATVFQRKRTVRTPKIVTKETEKERDITKEKELKRRTEKREIAVRRQGGIRPFSKPTVIISGSLSLILSGVSFYYYSKASDFHDLYMQETNPGEILSHWDNVKINAERHQAFMYSALGLGLFTVYEALTPKEWRNKKLSFELKERKEVLCLNLTLRF